MLALIKAGRRWPWKRMTARRAASHDAGQGYGPRHPARGADSPLWQTSYETLHSAWKSRAGSRSGARIANYADDS